MAGQQGQQVLTRNARTLWWGREELGPGQHWTLVVPDDLSAEGVVEGLKEFARVFHAEAEEQGIMGPRSVTGGLDGINGRGRRPRRRRRG